MYKTIIFDLDNTLIDYSLCDAHSLRTACAHFDLIDEDNHLEWETFKQIYSPISWHYWVHKDSLKLSRNQLVERTMRDTLEQWKSYGHLSEPLSEKYWELFCSTCFYEPGADKVIPLLSEHYSLGIITNGFSDSQMSRLTAGNLHKYFDAVVVADEVGYWKPDVRIFETALTQLNAEPHEVLFVGDSLEDDYKGAFNANIDFCYYDRNMQKPALQPRPRRVIHKLQELIPFLID